MRPLPGHRSLDARSLGFRRVTTCPARLLHRGCRFGARWRLPPRPRPYSGDLRDVCGSARTILDGHLPYLDATFEHLPFSLVPLLGGASPRWSSEDRTSTLALIVVSGCSSPCVLIYSRRIGHALGMASVPQRWLIAAAPLFPIVLYPARPPLAAVCGGGAVLLSIESRRVPGPASMLWSVRSPGAGRSSSPSKNGGPAGDASQSSPWPQSDSSPPGC